VRPLHDALSHVHDGRPLHAEHVVFCSEQLPHRLRQGEQARVALQDSKGVTRHTRMQRAASRNGSAHLAVIGGEAGVDVGESEGDGGVDGGGGGGDARCLVGVFACLKMGRRG
jgi:hypothetical protein